MDVKKGRQGNQTGSALAVALVFTLLMTIIGVAAMQTATLQERMAGNLRDRNLAFQAAEAALREGEVWVPDNLAALETADVLENAVAWDGASSPAPSGGYTVDDDQLFAQPTFHVGPPRRVRVGVEMPPVFRCLYPVTAHASGGSEAATVVLQSWVEPPGSSCE